MEILSISQIIVSVLLIISILLQERGTGVSSTFGGEGGYYFQKRGMEKIIFWSTVSLSVLFFGLALANFLI
ncbi:MAG TPA: preprotein translocase subunit SecG [Candidatus Pacearchaeota archaeon]|nr:preprotein translocase subunit SecG [Candidatus Pacearchaeota archaeon]HOK94339.1 preprotein translocase subunit SecG [Candidatus Pacearchaeota archaeon]HPO75290.1 preprotein translocase subunit SecG [Candidatus Pacearchaeota archaeon]